MLTSLPPTILMADDDVDDLELMEEKIKNFRTGIQFHSVINGRDALAYLEALSDEELPCLMRETCLPCSI